MRVIRFEDTQGKIRMGELQPDGRARLLDGELLGQLQPTGQTVPVRKLLAPITPVNIIAIGFYGGGSALLGQKTKMAAVPHAVELSQCACAARH